MSKKQKLYERFAESSERMIEHTKGKRHGYINWEMYDPEGRFKLECWNIEKNRKIRPWIFQIWPDGAGFQDYAPVP